MGETTKQVAEWLNQEKPHRLSQDELFVASWKKENCENLIFKNEDTSE